MRRERHTGVTARGAVTSAAGTAAFRKALPGRRSRWAGRTSRRYTEPLSALAFCERCARSYDFAAIDDEELRVDAELRLDRFRQWAAENTRDGGESRFFRHGAGLAGGGLGENAQAGDDVQRGHELAA